VQGRIERECLGRGNGRVSYLFKSENLGIFSHSACCGLTHPTLKSPLGLSVFLFFNGLVNGV